MNFEYKPLTEEQINALQEACANQSNSEVRIFDKEVKFIKLFDSEEDEKT